MISKIILVVFIALASNLTFAKCERDAACDSAEECTQIEGFGFKDGKCLKVGGNESGSTDCAQIADGSHGKGSAAGDPKDGGKSSSKSK